MNDIMAAPSPSRRKAPTTNTSGFTNSPSPSRAVHNDYSSRKSSLSNKRSARRQERSNVSRNSKVKDETKALQPHNKGSSSEIVPSRSDEAARSVKEYEEVCIE